MIKRDSIDRVIDTAQVDDVVGEFVSLKRRGSNMIGLCPFHNEKTPSFIVSPSKGIFKCFGCGESGNSVGFIMKHEQLNFPDAIRYLAKKYNIELEETERTEEEKQVMDQRESLFAITEFAKSYYQNQLMNTEDGQNIALAYFKERGFNQKTIDRFGLGWAPEGFHNFLNAALENQYDQDLLVKSGLIGEKKGNHYDFFRGRVIFPIYNHAGKIVAFAGRSLKSNDKGPKYINLAETEIYHKSQVLYGLNQAKQDIRKHDNCFMVEGYTDVISLSQAGVKNVVATSGTSLTDDHVTLLKRYTSNFTLLFDGDQAGIKAALRGVDMILPYEVNVKIVILPEDHDPDSFIKAKGYEQFSQFVEDNKQDFILFKLHHTLGGSTKDPVKRAEATKSVVESIALIPDNITRSFYVRECAEQLQVDEQLIHFEVNKARRQELKRKQQISAREKRQLDGIEQNQLDQPLQTDQEKLVQDKTYFIEKELLRMLLEYGTLDYDEEHSVADYVLHEIENIDFVTPKFNDLLAYYREKYVEDHQVGLDQFIHSDQQDIVQTAIEITSLPYDLSPHWWTRHAIKIAHEKEEIYHEEVIYTVTSFKLFRAQILLDEKIDSLKSINDVDEQIEVMLQIKNIKLIIKQNNDALKRNYYLH